METIADRLKYWDEQVETAQRALDYAIGQRVVVLETILVSVESEG